MHLQQTKMRSRASGGPQYYFHNIPKPVKQYLRAHGACPVVLQTPYGIASSSFMAVDRDHKLENGRVVRGSVGHDRIQQAGGEHSIGEAIRYWFGIRPGRDFERIEVEAVIHPDGHFILVPTAALMRGRKREQVLEKVASPLSFHQDYQSKLWRQQIETKRARSSEDMAWAGAQIARVVADHADPGVKYIKEEDLLRATGALSLLGLELGALLGRGYDCLKSKFQFDGLPIYHCPVEIKKRSVGFSYQVIKYTGLPRAVVLCVRHDYVNPPDHIDFIELQALADYLIQ